MIRKKFLNACKIDDACKKEIEKVFASKVLRKFNLFEKKIWFVNV